MASTYTSSIRLEKPAHNDYFNSWEVVMSRLFDMLDDAIAGTTTVNTTGGPTTLTSINGATDEARRAMLLVQGVLVGTAVITIPNVSKNFVVFNATTGAFAVTLKVTGGGTLDLPQATAALVATDGAGQISFATPPITSGGLVSTLALPAATATTPGAVRFATTAEALAGVVPSVVMSPAQVAAKITGSIPATLPSGTRLIFQQSAAPVGWTKDISVTDSMMRLTGGGASTGGTKPFATVFAAGHALSGRVGGTGLSVAQMPTHRHGMFGGQGGGTNQAAQQGTGGGGDPLQYNVGAANSEATIYQSGPSGSGATHDHDAGTLSIDMDVLYTSSIVAVKD